MSKFIDESGLAYIVLWIKNKLLSKVDKADGKQLTTNDYTDADKTKLAGLSNYAHPTSSGNKHIPAGGASGKILRWSADGTAVWGDDTDTVYVHPTYTPKSSGLYKVTVDATGHVSAADSVAKGDITGLGIPGQDTTYGPMTGAASGAAGAAGLVPAPAAGKQASYLRGDGTWAVPTNTTYSPATSSDNGLMSKADKAKLDAFGAAGTYALKSDITSMYRHKGTVAAVANLPATGQTAGDVYNVTASGMNYVWTGEAWDALGEIFTITAITNAEIDAILEA